MPNCLAMSELDEDLGKEPQRGWCDRPRGHRSTQLPPSLPNSAVEDSIRLLQSRNDIGLQLHRNTDQSRLLSLCSSGTDSKVPRRTIC